MAFKVACAGIAPDKAEVAKNLDRICTIVTQAVAEGADLVLFPETAVSGYFLEGGVLEVSMTSEQLLREILTRLPNRERPVDVVIGFYERHEGNLYNSAAYLELGVDAARVLKVYRKFFLPTYGVFDEERFVSRGKDVAVFETRLGKFALLICEDVWHSVLPAVCAVMGAQVLLVPAASPARGFAGDTLDNLDRYRRLFRSMSEEHGVFSINAQLCGFEGGKGFAGGSVIVDPTGKIVAESPIMDEHMIVADIDLDLVDIARAASPLLSDLQTMWSDFKRIIAETP